MLQHYISEVLYKQQTCCVPEVGTFTIQHIPAHFNVVEQQLVPPRQQILFEEKWDDDAACAQWVSHKENLVESVARLKMAKYVEQFKEEVASGQPVVIPDVGTLHKDPFGQTVFTPQEVPDAWEPLALQPVLRAQTAPKVTVGNTEMVNQQVVDHVSAVQENDGNFKWWWIVFPAALLCLGFAGWYFWQQQQLQQTPANEAITPETTVRAASQPAFDTGAVKGADSAAAPVVAAPPPANDTVQYYAVYLLAKASVAEKYYKQQYTWTNHQAVMYTKDDSASFRIAIPVRAMAKDTVAIKDSLLKILKVPVKVMDTK
ncbi:hypothetical protein MKQ70_17255 [Chitinophaga sedimenti]|uniref:HU domain-containing protein n=1 Tax=Chitinophaga sedimenti TaxID=2033606 RepID=UPI00200341CE|nr:hypothetical protein [Chitinophaga sedimenti]MCK7556671.1 hypothetical protein [Chitinophaga sedimenti]